MSKQERVRFVTDLQNGKRPVDEIDLNSLPEAVAGKFKTLVLRASVGHSFTRNDVKLLNHIHKQFAWTGKRK